MRYLITTLISLFVGLHITNAQHNKHLQLIPASDNVLAGLNIYNEDTGEFMQYYVKDAAWIKNPNVPTVNTSFEKDSQKLQYIQGYEGVAPGMFAYSCSSGHFEFYYLNNNEWTENEFLPKGKLKFKSSDIRMEFTSAKGAVLAYIFAYSTNGKEMKVLQVVDGAWEEITYFPKDIVSN